MLRTEAGSDYASKWRSIAETTASAIPTWNEGDSEIVLKRSIGTGTPLRELMDAIGLTVYDSMYRVIQGSPAAQRTLVSLAPLVHLHSSTKGQAFHAASQAAQSAMMSGGYWPLVGGIVMPAAENGVQKCTLIELHKQTHGFTNDWRNRMTVFAGSVNFLTYLICNIAWV